MMHTIFRALEIKVSREEICTFMNSFGAPVRSRDALRINARTPEVTI